MEKRNRSATRYIAFYPKKVDQAQIRVKKKQRKNCQIKIREDKENVEKTSNGCAAQFVVAACAFGGMLERPCPESEL